MAVPRSASVSEVGVIHVTVTTCADQKLYDQITELCVQGDVGSLLCLVENIKDQSGCGRQPDAVLVRQDCVKIRVILAKRDVDEGAGREPECASFGMRSTGTLVSPDFIMERILALGKPASRAISFWVLCESSIASAR